MGDVNQTTNPNKINKEYLYWILYVYHSYRMVHWILLQYVILLESSKIINHINHINHKYL